MQAASSETGPVRGGIWWGTDTATPQHRLKSGLNFTDLRAVCDTDAEKGSSSYKGKLNEHRRGNKDRY